MATDDDGMTYSNLLYGVSPCGGRDDDESSVDIYDGLDGTSVASGNPATTLTRARNNLNLYDELLIEEGTAKEASYHDLQAENERCQQQLQELMKKLQEIQEQNSTLQNENQSLKKNISALIKTARVEINRKDEEISNLQRSRLSEFPVHQNAYTRTYVQASTNHARNFERSKAKTHEFRDSLPENNPKMGPRTKQVQPKDIPHSYPSGDTENKKFHSDKRNGMNIPKPRPQEVHSDGVHSRLTNVDSAADKEKGKRELKSNDCRYKSQAHQNGGSTANKMLDVHEKSLVNPEKTVRNGLWKDSKGLKIRDCPQTEKFPKQLMLKDKLLSKAEHSSSDRVEKSQNINQKDLKPRNKDDYSGGQKNRQSQRRQDSQRRTGKESNLPERDISAKSPQKLSIRCLEDRKRKDSDSRHSRDESEHGFRERKSSPLPPLISSRDRKYGHSKEDSNKHKSESIRSKLERHRTEEKRKSEKDSLRESRNVQNERTNSKDTLQKTAKETIEVQGSARKEGNTSFPPEEIAKVVDDLEQQMTTESRKTEEQSKSKDLKLSFMQTLNLTLSPAKKQVEYKTESKSINDYDKEILGEKNMLVPAEPITSSTTEQIKTLPECIPNNCVQANLEQSLISESRMNVENEGVAETLDTAPSKTTSDLQKTECELADNAKVLPQPRTKVEEADETLLASSPGSPLDQGTLPDSVFHDLETISSVDFDSLSVIDEINGTDSDSLMETEETSNFASENAFKTPEKENMLPKPVPFQNTVEKSKLKEDVPLDDQKASHWKPSFPGKGDNLETCKVLSSTLQVRDTQLVSADDDNSILSIDLNHMRCIPKVISPLNSPIRPLAKALRMESLYKGPVKNYNIVPEGAVVCPTKNLSSDLNKENQKPLCTDHQVLEMESQLCLSSDELEEGEIVSEDDDKPTVERHSEDGKKSRGKASPDRSNLANCPHNQNADTTPSSEDTGKLPSRKKKSKEKSKPHTISSKEVKKKKTVNINCLEKIIQITAEPSTVHEVMQMLRAIRKQLRKNYMKLKVQFPIQHFHRIIDSATLNFTSLIKYLDFSKVSKTSKTLKLNLCEVIESKLWQIKKNSAIEHLFEQQQSEMKKKLWKLVDEQLDFLFDKIKKILLKLCNWISIGNESDEAKPDKRTTKSPKCLVSHKTARQKSKKPPINARPPKPEECTLPKPVVGNLLSNKMDAPKNMTTKQTGSYSGNTKRSQAGVELFKEKFTQDTEPTLKAEKREKGGLQDVGDCQKSDLSCGPLTEQQMSGLTFNLVNDAQMGEMFKSLLQGSGLSEKNVDFIDENQWVFKTPIKHMPDSQTCGDDPAYEAEESIPKETRTESRVLDDIKWPVVSPERESSFLSRLQMPIDPDILDESCMFEIPTSPALKKGEGCISGRPKSLVSSILLEDLAVSLTIPSPLKSDSHLSFLKPDVFGSVPEDVLSAHFSEDAHLEEEDASEQDIHLALESDNSSSKSSCSSSWASTPAAPGFQYCPSLPMQAVIMEKSNDHFIVKIRRAAPSTSPGLDGVSVANEPLTTFTERADSKIKPEESLDTLNSKSISLEEAAVSKEKRTESESQVLDNIVKEQASDLLESLKEPLARLEKVEEAKQSEAQQDARSSAPDNVLESVEALFSNSKQEQHSNISVPLPEPYSNISPNQGPDSLITHQTLHSDKPSIADLEETSDLLDQPKEMEKCLESLKVPPNKTSHSEDSPEVFELPQTDTKREIQKVASCAIVEHSPMSSAAIPLEDEFSSEAHFSMCIDLTDEPSMEDEVDSWDLVVESALSEGTRGLSKDNEECKTADCCLATDLEHSGKEVINLTEELSDKPETKVNLNIDDPGGQTSLDKERKKRKKETEETSSAKRQRKESCESVCKKTVKSSKKPKETVSILSKKTVSVRDKDAVPSTSSLSPCSLYAKNIVKKKGEVIVSWTRDDDREILLECQKQGPSEKTFASLATRLNKSSNQVEERFKQLVKLFKMSHCS
ncbi:hypothetical protein lerEdw1_001264 [Lerista edwardsae]|nr:hypothetical protein lerEdw1_001264 [Lerista edwardsae]